MKTPFRRPKGTTFRAPKIKPASLAETRSPGVDYSIDAIRKGSKSHFANRLTDAMIRNGVKTPSITLPIKEYKNALVKKGKHFLAEKQAQFNPRTIAHTLQLVAQGSACMVGQRLAPAGESCYEEAEPMTQEDVMISGEGYQYTKRITWRSSWISKEMKANMEQYKKAKYTFVDSENPQSTLWNRGLTTDPGLFEPAYLNTMYSQSGYNRWSYVNTLSYYIPSLPGPVIPLPGTQQVVTPFNPYIMRGFLSTSLQRMAFITQHLMSATALEFMMIEPTQQIYKGKEGGERDFLFGIRSQTTTLDLFSRNPDFAVEISIYSCIYKQATNFAPQDLLSDWVPEADPADSIVNQFPDAYVFRTPVQNSTGSVLQNWPDLQDPLSNTRGFPECSVVPGCTPSFSNRFKAYANVENVHKVQLQPNDKATFHFTEEFSQAHSLREMKARHVPIYPVTDPADPTKFWYGGPAFSAGDRFLLIEHHGAKGTVEYDNDSAKSVWNCENTPSRISFQWRNSFEWYAPNQINTDIGQYFTPEGTDIPFRGTSSIQSTARELNFDTSSLQSFQFDDPTMTPVAGSNVDYNPRLTKID